MKSRDLRGKELNLKRKLYHHGELPATKELEVLQRN